MIATIFALFYGNYHKLHARLLNSLKQYGPVEQVRYRFWLNQVGDATRRTIDELAADRDMQVHASSENVPKYIVMRELFDTDRQLEQQPEWLLWFDDDSHIVAVDWWAHMLTYIKDNRDENICYVGRAYYVHHLPGQEDFIKAAKWYKGVAWEMCPTKNPRVLRPGIAFAQGAYWWLRRDVRELIDWPDKRLSHNGGDSLLGEAVRQQRLPFHRYYYGVRMNDAKRRGLSERPAGSTIDVRR